MTGRKLLQREAPIVGAAITRAAEDAVHVRSEDDRLIDIRLVPWGVVAQTADGPESFARGAFDGVDPARVTIESGAHGGPLVGRGTALEQRDDAAYLTARIAPTPAGDDLLTLARERVLQDASVSFYPRAGGSRRRAGATERTAVDLRRVAILERGSYPGAGIVAIREQPAPDPEPTPTPDPTPPEPTASERAILAELGALRVSVGRGPGRDPYLALREMPSLGEACVRAWTDPEFRDLLTRVLVDEITSDNPGVVPPGWVTDVKTIMPPRRPAVQAFGSAGLPTTGMDFSWPTYTGDIKALIAKQVTQKTALNSAKISFGKGTQAIETFGFVHDVAYQLILRSAPSYIASANQVLLGAFAYYEDAALIAGITAAAGKGSVTGDAPATADTIRAALFEASLDVQTATGAPASFGLAASDVFAAFGGLAGLYPAVYGTTNATGTAAANTLAVNVSGLPIIHDPNLAAGTLWVSNEQTATWHVDGPRFASAEDVEKLGRNDAIWGMGAAAVYVPAGIVVVTGVIPADASAARRSRG